MLQQFRYGVFKDNALTYMLRTGDLKRMRYLLEREGDPTIYNHEGFSTLHFAILSKRHKLISYLFFGQFENCLNSMMYDCIDLDLYFRNAKKCPWMWKTLLGLDQGTCVDGFTPFHIAC